ncbi:MAG TPA: D-arabinono-1,4-lactone oxidase [Cellulomonas sp.]|uniref:D-arabinono-1,4-lactone oxidase n=1 Tax=Cellulomonas sp. TaxID=40001 RepID=UPI002E341079|nr:D-arabinono-1,4-lactone oxidase [Cellulomonas sp.]HEX5331992.1 D-arabinono-1,4-lactone oxidase [Cellulomonas sp.]
MSSRSTSDVWHNWARTEAATPTRVARPRDLDELVAAVRGADGLHVRAVGAGHSFTGAAVTDGVQVRLDALSGIERVTTQPDGTAHVTVGAGTHLSDLNVALAERGLAMRNLGDIDRQTIAGAISTGTHGTGARLGGLASQVVGVRVVTAQGDVVEASPAERPDLFEVARLGLGSVGLLAAVTLDVVPAFRLRAVEEPWALDAVLERLTGTDGLVEANDHFEFYWFPHTRRALTKRNNRVPDDDLEPLSPVRAWVDDELLSNTLFAATNHLTAAVPRLTPRVNAFAARALSARTYTAPSYEVFASPRRVRFRELEYAIPRDAVRPALAEIERWLASTGEHIPFPVEVRFAAPDDVWLSTAYQRESAYVAVHQYIGLPYVRYLRAVERIMAGFDGRPHWGKLHWLDADRLAQLYPRFTDAQRVRATADPDGVFTNDYLNRVLGPVR